MGFEIALLSFLAETLIWRHKDAISSLKGNVSNYRSDWTIFVMSMWILICEHWRLGEKGIEENTNFNMMNDEMMKAKYNTLWALHL